MGFPSCFALKILHSPQSLGEAAAAAHVDDEADVVVEDEEPGDGEECEALAPDLIRKADDLISQSFVDGKSGDLESLVELILDHGLPVDYQVSSVKVQYYYVSFHYLSPFSPEYQSSIPQRELLP